MSTPREARVQRATDAMLECFGRIAVENMVQGGSPDEVLEALKRMLESEERDGWSND